MASVLLAVFFISISIFQVGYSSSLVRPGMFKQLSLLKSKTSTHILTATAKGPAASLFTLKKCRKALVQSIQSLQKVKLLLLSIFAPALDTYSNIHLSSVFDIVASDQYFIQIGSLLI